jgi:TRAP-type mannitol/chloroaromatic compound transport system substrate-binding protein
VLVAAEQAAFELYDEFSASDSSFGTILSPWNEFRTGIQQWHSLAEKAMLDFGALER